MAYTTPITDRTLADVQAHNAKGYFNVADWQRIYGNSQLVNSLVAIRIDTPITFALLTTPTITTIPSVTEFNIFLANIEEIRLNVDGEPIPGIAIPIKCDWVAGVGQRAPDYSQANLWEKMLDAIWTYYNGPSLSVCPTLSSDLTVVTGANAIYVDCIDMANFNIDIQGTGNLYIL
jgi:hypothetical protein